MLKILQYGRCFYEKSGKADTDMYDHDWAHLVRDADFGQEQDAGGTDQASRRCELK